MRESGDFLEQPLAESLSPILTTEISVLECPEVCGLLPGAIRQRKNSSRLSFGRLGPDQGI